MLTKLLVQTVNTSRQFSSCGDSSHFKLYLSK